MAHAILQVTVRMCVGWCGLVRVRSCVLVGMCSQRCALIVARPYRQSPLEYAPATVSRPSRPKVMTLPRKTAGVQKRAPLLPEPSRARRCHGFAALETKSDDLSTQNCGGPKARAATARAL